MSALCLITLVTVSLCYNSMIDGEIGVTSLQNVICQHSLVCAALVLEIEVAVVLLKAADLFFWGSWEQLSPRISFPPKNGRDREILVSPKTGRTKRRIFVSMQRTQAEV